MRRKTRDPLTEAGIPESLAIFDARQWTGESEYQQWTAWYESRLAWAAANLPRGVEDLPDRIEQVPDAPWDEVKHLI